MGTSISKWCKDPFGFGNTEIAKKFAKFEPIPNLTGLKVAITGANSGIGLAAAKRLAENGANVILLCRDIGKAKAARELIKGDVSITEVDMTNFESISNLKLPDVDMLIHNAGAMFNTQENVIWPTGKLDQTFALHVAGPYLLSSKVNAKYTIWVSSGGMYSVKLNVEKTINPNLKKFDGMDAYARCKRAQVVIARRLGHQSMHPGWSETPGVRSAMPEFSKKVGDIFRTSDEGADTIVWLAAKRPKELGFWFDRERVTEFKVPFTSHNVEEEELLIKELNRVTGKN